MNYINELKKIMVQADPEVIEVTLTPEKFPEAYKRSLKSLWSKKRLIQKKRQKSGFEQRL